MEGPFYLSASPRMKGRDLIIAQPVQEAGNMLDTMSQHGQARGMVTLGILG